MRLLKLNHYHKTIEKRKIPRDTYRIALTGIKGISVLRERESTSDSYTYFTIFVKYMEYGISRTRLYEKLKQQNINSGLYFNPLISKLSMHKELDKIKTIKFADY